MSIAEKLTTIAENEQKVYDAGKEAENKRYWEKFWAQIKNPNGSTYYLRNAFCGGGWNEETFSKIIYPSEKISASGGAAGQGVFLYFNRNYTYNTPPIDLSEFCRRVDFSGITDASNLFYNARAKNITVDLSNCTSVLYAFQSDNGGSLDNITVKVTNKCTTYTRTFYNQKDLTEIRFMDGSEITKAVSFAQSNRLTDESIQSIIDALGTVTTTQKITFHDTVVNKLTDEQVSQIVNKGWEIG